MTKAIRIENADTSDHKVKVEVMNENDELVNVHLLTYPTSMITDYIHSGQYLVVREVEKD